MWGRFNRLHGIGFGPRPLQRTTQAHLVRAVPERGARVKLDDQEGLVPAGFDPHHHTVPQPCHEQWGRRLNRGLTKAFPMLHSRSQEEDSMGEANDGQRDNRVRREFPGGHGVPGVVPFRRLPGRVQGQAAGPAGGPRPDVGQQGHEQSSGCRVPFVSHDLAPGCVVLPPVLHHVDLISAEEGHAVPPGGRLDRLESAEASGFCAGGVRGLKLPEDLWVELTFWSRNCGAFLCGGSAFTALIAPTQHEGTFHRPPVRTPPLRILEPQVRLKLPVAGSAARIACRNACDVGWPETPAGVG